MPVGYNGQGRDKVLAAQSSLARRAEIGEHIVPGEFPAEDEVDRTDPSRNLNLPMWYSSLQAWRR